MATLAAANLVLLAVSDYRIGSNEMLLGIHSYSTILMFIFSGCAMFMLSQLVSNVLDLLPQPEDMCDKTLSASLTQSLTLKRRCSWVFLVSAVLHIIPGYFLMPFTIPDLIMSMEKCGANGLKKDYCKYYQDPNNHNMTLLPDLSDYPHVNYSPVTQYILVLVQLGYVFLLRFDFVFVKTM